MTDLPFPALGASAHHAHLLEQHYPDYTAWLSTLADSDLQDEYNDRFGDRYDDDVARDKFCIVNRRCYERKASGRYLEETH